MKTIPAKVPQGSVPAVSAEVPQGSVPILTVYVLLTRDNVPSKMILLFLLFTTLSSNKLQNVVRQVSDCTKK